MIKLVIFDCDGVVIDSEGLYLDIADRVSKMRGYNVPKEAVYSTLGANVIEMKKIILSYMGSDFDYDTYYNEICEIKAREIIDNPPLLKKGFNELIEYLRNNNIATALATSTEREKQCANLKRINILNCFDYMIFGDEVENSKPNPEIYLKVINHFDYDKEGILIIEDTPNGIKSGMAAGVRVIYCPDYAVVPEEMQKQVYTKVEDLTGVIGIIEKLNK